MSNPILSIPNAFNVGTDVSGILSDDTNLVTKDISDFGQLEEVEARGEQHDIKITPVSRGGIPLYQTLWSGGSGHLKYTRVFGAISFVWVALMRNYYYLHQLPNFSLSLAVINRDASVDEYLFGGMVLTSPTWGTARGDKQMDQELHFKFGTLQIVSPNAPAPGASPLSFT